jgi:hypothetical protein
VFQPRNSLLSQSIIYDSIDSQLNSKCRVVKASDDLFHLYAVMEAFDNHFCVYVAKLVIGVSASLSQSIIYNSIEYRIDRQGIR